MSNNRYERNPCLHRDTPENLFKSQGVLSVTFYNSKDQQFPCVLHYQIEGIDFTLDCSQIKDVWEEQFKDDLVHSIDRKLGNFFLTHRDLNLNIRGI